MMAMLLEKLIFQVVFPLYSSLFWEWRDEGNLKNNLHFFSWKPRSHFRSMLEYMTRRHLFPPKVLLNFLLAFVGDVIVKDVGRRD